MDVLRSSLYFFNQKDIDRQVVAITTDVFSKGVGAPRIPFEATAFAEKKGLVKDDIFIKIITILTGRQPRLAE